jgi:hypothetical protein
MRCLRTLTGWLVVVLLWLRALNTVAQAKTFHCSAGDVQCLIAAITATNASGKKNVIQLEAGTYTLMAVDNQGPNGLPVITSRLTIHGAGPDLTILERNVNAPPFRLMVVAATGALTLDGLTLRGGGPYSPVEEGGGIWNAGALTLTRVHLMSNGAEVLGGGLYVDGGTVLIRHSLITDNDVGHVGGGLYGADGTISIAHTTVANNLASDGGGLAVFGGTVTITDSTMADNLAVDPNTGGGGLLVGGGLLTMTSSTVAGNSAPEFGGGGLFITGGLTRLINVTITENQAPPFPRSAGGGGILGSGGTVSVQNTILARNTAGNDSSDCVGTVTSQGNNLIGDPTGCTIPMQGTDLTGDPGLGAFTDDGTPGDGHFPLLPTSPAINAGNPAACPKQDQLGEPRVGPCDIGAIEFQGAAMAAQ